MLFLMMKQKALDYHSKGRKGKIEVIPTKPVATQADLSLAYTPGVAEPCRAIALDDSAVYEYTCKGNLVAVVSNGTAVLGLGNIGPHASKPVMEGKGILFKQLADIDVFDIELNAPTPEEVIQACKALEPTFGGINLEDIKAPDCFIIEDALKAALNIPVFHDDQHGTAIICGAAFLNALEISQRDITKAKVVFSGGGAAAMACANIFISIGVKPENIIMCDTKGVIYRGRTEGMNSYKEKFASNTSKRCLSEALEDADAFIGVSAANALTPEMVMKMAPQPIIFAMANPDPEILPEVALVARPDAIMATGRSDYPNQVNNVLGFPYIFRGALDVRAKQITEEMKLAAMYALARLAKEPVPQSVCDAYGGIRLEFGKNYLIPKPMDSRVLTWVTPAVARAAMESGVARKPIEDMEAYKEQLLELILKRDAHASHRTSLREQLVDGVLPTMNNAGHLPA
jgi:malate dehydrogenase (oxaloacetate-decarboxylating)(NADP+)